MTTVSAEKVRIFALVDRSKNAERYKRGYRSPTLSNGGLKMSTTPGHS
jgi:hypothetical protein